MKWILAILLLMPSVLAISISDWPMMFVTDGKFSAKYVVGDEANALDVVSATVVSTSLARYENVTTEVGTSKIDSEISDITMYNAVVIGTPCEMKTASQLMGNPEPCYKDLAGGIGYIKVYEKNGRKQLLITGLNEKDRNAAAKYLAEKDLKRLNLAEYLVQSNSGSMPQLYEKLKINTTNTTKTNQTILNHTTKTVITPKKITNQTQITNITKNVTIEKKTTEYKPIKEMPAQERGFFGRIWHWFKSLFS